MNTPTKSDPDIEIKQTSQEKLEERESWHKLVVKVILWSDASANNGPVRVLNELSSTSGKLTQSEWNTYYKRMVKINVNQNKEKTLADLNYTLQQIKLHRGFEETK